MDRERNSPRLTQKLPAFVLARGRGRLRPSLLVANDSPCGLDVALTPRAISRPNSSHCAINGTGPCVPFDDPTTTFNTVSVASFAGIQGGVDTPRLSALSSAMSHSAISAPSAFARPATKDS